MAAERNAEAERPCGAWEGGALRMLGRRVGARLKRPSARARCEAAPEKAGQTCGSRRKITGPGGGLGLWATNSNLNHPAGMMLAPHSTRRVETRRAE